MSNPSLQVAARMSSLTTNFQAADSTATKQAGLLAKRIHEDELRKAAGSDLRMSGVGTKGAKVGARFETLRVAEGVVVKATGPVHLLEHPSQAHTIISKKVGRGAKGRGARRANKQALYDALFGGNYAGTKPLRTPYGPRYRVQHPGVRSPKKPWEKGFRRSVPVIQRTVQQKYSSAFGRSVRG